MILFVIIFLIRRNTPTEPIVPTYSIETQHGEFQYPERWKNQIRIDEKENYIDVWGQVEGKEEVLLFSLYFGEEKGNLIGTLNGTEVYLCPCVREFDETWTEEEVDWIYSMQDDSNILVQKLSEQKGFKSAKRR